MKAVLLVALAGAASVAQAGLYTQADVNGDMSRISAASLQGTGQSSRTADAYFLGGGIGGAGGFALSTPSVDSIFNGAGEALGADIFGGNIISSDFTISGDVSALGETTFQIQLDTDGPDLFSSTPFSVGGLPVTDGGLFLGANAGGTAMSFVNPTFMKEAIMYFLDAAGAPIAAFDVTGLMGTNLDGTWDGSAGVTVGNLADLGTVTAGFQFTVTSVPAPGTAALLGLGGLIATRRRR
ncbi:MAG: PEP-CTERM sorting domain-containing protein [Phycisphaerales bacterium]|nr:PEP-CTERM sorting domain-containing protein [Phycisphaerales bacterium]